MNSKELLLRVLRGNATAQQRKQLNEWLDSIPSDVHNPSDIESTNPPDLAEIRNLVRKNTRAQRSIRRYFVVTILAVVIVVIALTSTNNNKELVLVFRNATLDQVIKHIESNYAVTISIRSDIENCSFTGEFYHNETVEEILSTISAATGLQYQKKEQDHFEITGVSCQSIVE